PARSRPSGAGGDRRRRPPWGRPAAGSRPPPRPRAAASPPSTCARSAPRPGPAPGDAPGGPALRSPRAARSGAGAWRAARAWTWKSRHLRIESRLPSIVRPAPSASRMRPMKVLALAGSLRAASFNRKLLAVAVEALRGRAEIDLLDLHDIPMPLYDGDVEAAGGPPEGARRFKERLAGADALLIATPEYNRGIPGT